MLFRFPPIGLLNIDILLFISNNTLIPEPHFIIVDTNVVLHQLDVLDDEKIVNVVILQVGKDLFLESFPSPSF